MILQGQKTSGGFCEHQVFVPPKNAFGFDLKTVETTLTPPSVSFRTCNDEIARLLEESASRAVGSWISSTGCLVKRDSLYHWNLIKFRGTSLVLAGWIKHHFEIKSYVISRVPWYFPHKIRPKCRETLMPQLESGSLMSNYRLAETFTHTFGWWFRTPANSPVEGKVVEIPRFTKSCRDTSQVGGAGLLNHQQ